MMTCSGHRPIMYVQLRKFLQSHNIQLLHLACAAELSVKAHVLLCALGCEASTEHVGLWVDQSGGQVFVT